MFLSMLLFPCFQVGVFCTSVFSVQMLPHYLHVYVVHIDNFSLTEGAVLLQLCLCKMGLFGIFHFFDCPFYIVDTGLSSFMIVYQLLV